jgi:dethiobiotin synthetase
LRGVFVAGTDTGVGKSVVAAAVCAGLAARGERGAAVKPAVTGTHEDTESGWPRDHELLAASATAGQTPEQVAPYRFGPPVSPHYAAELEETVIEPTRLVKAATGAGETVVCEGVGGLLVPLTPGYLVRDLALELGLPVVVAARPGLGTINHTLLSVESARAVGLRVAGVVMTPWPHEPRGIERSNRETVERLAAVTVSALPPTRPESLAEAAAHLPLDDWLG